MPLAPNRVRGRSARTNLGLVLPYPSYLRVYEPAEVVPIRARTSVESEQRRTLSMVLTSAVPSTGTPVDGDYVIQESGRDYVCPADLSLRTWLSLTAFVESFGDATAGMIIAPEALSSAGDHFLRWRRDHPEAVPHIRQSTWGVPRTWFVLVVEAERRLYASGAGTSVRYRARLHDARNRADDASRTLRSVIDDGELLDDLDDLRGWLGAFHDDSWVELDYAGVARLLPGDPGDDRSAAEVHQAIAAVRRGDFGTAGSAYRTLEDRWRSVSAFERAN